MMWFLFVLLVSSFTFEYGEQADLRSRHLQQEISQPKVANNQPLPTIKNLSDELVPNRKTRSVPKPRLHMYSTRSPDFVDNNIEFMGWHYAGLSEYPWVVDIRTLNSEDNRHQELWSVGNLITHDSVLTSCRAVADFDFIHDYPRKKSGLFLTPRQPVLYKVMFAPNFLYIDNEGKTGQIGDRMVLAMRPHPSCYHQVWKYDLGIVTIQSIMPFPPYIGYMPMTLVLDKLEIEFKRPKSRPWDACTVVTWGRNLADDVEYMLHNYKISVKVKFESQDYCKVAITDMMTCQEEGLLSDCSQILDNTVCMTPITLHDEMGVVCDHDRGAPVICDDHVIGIVAKGVKLEFCSMENSLPFTVQPISPAVKFYTHLSQSVLHSLLAARGIDNDLFSASFSGLLAPAKYLILVLLFNVLIFSKIC